MEERRAKILKLINERGDISFTELKNAFSNVSEMTLRKDLKFLDSQKSIVRVHGGARSIDTVQISDLPLAFRLRHNSSKKFEIANKAKALIKENDVIFLDSGSSSTHLSRVFPNITCTVFTNSLQVAINLCELDKLSLFMFGGEIKRESLSIKGQSILSDLNYLHFDTAFISSAGFILDEGVSTKNSDRWLMSREIVRRSSKNIILMDSTKFDKQFHYIFAKIDEIDTIVSDSELNPDVISALKARGVTVL